MKKAVVTGAAGFAGCNLTEHLIASGWFVYAIVRPGSPHNERLNGLKNVYPIELDISDYGKISSLVPEPCDAFFHLAWNYAARDDFYQQHENLQHSLVAVEAAVQLSCRRILITGSQAEYGLVDGLMTEDLLPNPVNAYGAAKVAACYLTKRRAEQFGLEWIWGRIFSLVGKYEPSGRMIPDLIATLKRGETPHLSSCTQYWDYLDAGDAAECIIALMEHGKNGEIYNIANGDYKPLKIFTETIRNEIAPNSNIIYGGRATPFIELRPSMSKTKQITAWTPVIPFDAFN